MGHFYQGLTRVIVKSLEAASDWELPRCVEWETEGGSPRLTQRVMNAAGRLEAVPVLNVRRTVLTMENPACYAVDSEVTFQKLGEETVLVSLTTGKIHHTNETGSRVWELLKEGRSVGEILELLEKQFNASREALQTEVTAFVEQLSQEHMIRLLEPDE